jgi:hypothetical protein
LGGRHGSAQSEKDGSCLHLSDGVGSGCFVFIHSVLCVCQMAPTWHLSALGYWGEQPNVMVAAVFRPSASDLTREKTGLPYITYIYELQPANKFWRNVRGIASSCIDWLNTPAAGMESSVGSRACHPDLVDVK